MKWDLFGSYSEFFVVTTLMFSFKTFYRSFGNEPDKSVPLISMFGLLSCKHNFTAKAEKVQTLFSIHVGETKAGSCHCLEGR